MRLFRWFSTLTVVIVLAGATPTLALDMTDEAARERVADWAHRCHFLRVDDLWRTGLDDIVWDIIADEQRGREFLARVQEKGGPVSAAREYLDTCMPVYRRVADAGQLELCSNLGLTVTRMGHHWLEVLGDTDRYPDTQGQLDSAARQAVEDYLRTCVPPYAAALDGRLPDDVPASGDHASADQTGPLHGSIAFSQEGEGAYAWGIAWSFDSSARAQSEAISQCREYGGTQCAEAGWFREACGALAIGGGNGYGTGWGATIAEAERDALAQCRAVNDDCRIEVARCSQSQEAGGRGQMDEEDMSASAAPEPLCGVSEYLREMEASNHAGCRFCYDRSLGSYFPENPQWSGSCSNGVADGTGTVTWKVGYYIMEATAAFSAGLPHGYWFLTTIYEEGHQLLGEEEGAYVEGKRDGNWEFRGAICHDSSYSNGEFVDVEYYDCE